jgi:hypothetical protein
LKLITAEWRFMAPSSAGLSPRKRSRLIAGCTSASRALELFERREAGMCHDFKNCDLSFEGRRRTAGSLLVLRVGHAGKRSSCLHRRTSSAALRGRTKLRKQHRRRLPVLQQPPSSPPRRACARCVSEHHSETCSSWTMERCYGEIDLRAGDGIAARARGYEIDRLFLSGSI